MTIRRFILTLLILFVFSSVLASSSFIVRKIEVEGLQRLSEGTVLSYIPVHIGQHFSESQGTAIIKALYKTGLIKNVSLERRGNTLIVIVKEQPTISLVSFDGIKEIPVKKLKPFLKKMDVVEGGVYDSAKLHSITQGLQQEYQMLGHYNAKVNVAVKPTQRNTVAVTIYAVEGPVAKVRSIKFIGNKAFSHHQLLSNFKLTTSGLMTLVTHNDRYSKNQLGVDLGKLKEFYLNHGYLRFRVVSKKVDVSANFKDVTIVITVDEGPAYRVSGYKIEGAGKQTASLNKYITLKKGDLFSRSETLKIDTNIAHHYADNGYAFPDIHVIPSINDTDQKVYLTFKVEKGKRIYVRRINFAGNGHTKDYVLRSQMRQIEDSEFSLKDINESKRNLKNLPYLSNIEMTPNPVANNPHQVDLNYHVKEVNAGRASVQGGYSDVDGFLYGASVSEPNFMGTGKAVSIGFQNSKGSQNYSISHSDPFYTLDGISRSFSLYYTRETPGKVNLESYKTNNYGASVTYGIPLTEFSSYSLGVGYAHIRISNVDRSIVSPSVWQFVNEHKSPYNQFNFTSGIYYSTLDRAIFPTDGVQQSLSLTIGAPVLRSSLGYYKTSYTAKKYIGIGAGFIFKPHVKLGYGNGFGDVNSLPFFTKFYAGGIDTMPGFDGNTLGPKNPQVGQSGTSIGGNIEALAGFDIILPNFVSEKLRTALIVNAGNIWDTNHVKDKTSAGNATKYDSISLKNVRVSAGIMVSWWWPMGAPINFSLAFPVHKKAGDQLQAFGFSFSTGI